MSRRPPLACPPSVAPAVAFLARASGFPRRPSLHHPAVLLTAATVLLVTAAGSAAAPVQVTGIRHYSGPDQTRIVVELSGGAPYRTSTRTGPDRVVIDIPGGHVGTSLEHDVDDTLVRRVRLNQLRDGAQVVLDLRRPLPFTHFALPPSTKPAHPDRIVVDVSSGRAEPRRGDRGVETPRSPARSGPPPAAAASGPIVVVIDPGHGGDDPGASAFRDLREKHITLEVGRALYERLRREPGIEPRLTRDRDRTLSLSDRQTLVEDFQGDLLVSIHANSSPNKKADGAEVYYLSLRSGRRAAEGAAREAAEKGDLARILSDLDHEEGMFLSGRLAREVAREMDRIRNIRVRKVHQAGFQVLKLDGVPAVLVEIGFLSNPKEARHLMDARYPEEAAERLGNAIMTFVHEYLTGAPSGVTSQREDGAREIERVEADDPDGAVPRPSPSGLAVAVIPAAATH